MTDKLREQAERGQHAERLKNDPLLNEAFEKLKASIIQKFTESKADESELREDAHKSIRLLEHLRQHLIMTAANGEAARKELLKIKEQSKLRQIING